MSLKKAKEFMEKFGEKFTPIKINNKELLEGIKEIREEKRGFSLTLLDLTKMRTRLDDKEHDWWDKVIKKYNISEKYRHNLVYSYDKKEIKRK